MKLQVLAVYDSKAHAFLLPFFVSHIAVGARSFSQAADTPGNQINGSPEDFTLWHLGTWDDDKAVFDLKVPYVNLGLATQYQKGVERVQPKVA